MSIVRQMRNKSKNLALTQLYPLKCKWKHFSYYCFCSNYRLWQHPHTIYRSEPNPAYGSDTKRFTTCLQPLEVPKGEQNRPGSNTESSMRAETLLTSSIREGAPAAIACDPCNGDRAWSGLLNGWLWSLYAVNVQRQDAGWIKAEDAEIPLNVSSGWLWYVSR